MTLEQAKLLFPAGTKFRSMITRGIIRTVNENPEYSIEKGGSEIVVTTTYSKAYIFKDGKQAEIVEPHKQEPLLNF